ncbi:MAG: TIGR04283 family arsenosugar biosynthesis glycosyltransferase [Pseudomonadota bacterium]
MSVVIPVLNEAGLVEDAIRHVRSQDGLVERELEIIVVDGGSSDGTAQRAANADRVLVSDPGRAIQMNLGARHARGDVVLFLHADTQLPDAAVAGIRTWFRRGGVWGGFHVAVHGQSPWLKVVSRGINLRARVSGILTGDQAIYTTRKVLEEEGYFAEIPLMEDIELSRRFRKRCWPFLIHQPVRTSGRRWDQGGVFRTVGFMWYLRICYALGRDPAELASLYRPVR